jgi:hypothetical protein
VRLAECVARIGKTRNGCKILVENPEGKRSLWRPRRRWEDNIKIYFKEIVLKTFGGVEVKYTCFISGH